jgi:hypothetical protein
VNAADITFSSAAILTRQLQKIFSVGDIAKGQILSQDIFQVDPQCPFFYIFAMGGQGTATTGAGFQTKFDFFNGGTPITSTVIGWGNATVVNAAGIPFVELITTPNDGIAYFIDAVSGTCSGVNPGTLFYQGFIKRWTALADQITVTTAALAAATESSYGVVHGVLQQPW